MLDDEKRFCSNCHSFNQARFNKIFDALKRWSCEIFRLPFFVSLKAYLAKYFPHSRAQNTKK